MKSMFDNYFGSPINSRAAMQEKIREMKTDGSVIQETLDAVAARTLADEIEGRINFAKNKRKSQWQKVTDKSSFVPYVGDCVNRQ